MARKIVNIGSQGNDGTGDSIRESFKKVNENFRELYSIFGAGDSLKFSDLADAPASYAENQLFIAGKTTPSSATDTIQAKSLIAGEGVNISFTPTSVVIGASSGLNSSRPTLTAGLNAAGFGIANALQPDDAGIDNKITAWNLLHGTGISVNDLLINRRYADSRYAPLESSKPLVLRQETSGSEFIKTITGYASGNVLITGHGFTSADTGKGYRFTTTGTLPTSSPALQNNGLYFIRIVSSDSISLHLSKSGAETNTGKITINAAGSGTAQLIHQHFDQSLSGGWLTTEAVPRSAALLRSGDTMTGPLILSGAPSANLHAATKQYVDTQITQSGLTSADELPENPISPANLYFKVERARAAITVNQLVGAGGTIEYNSTTGVIKYTAITSEEVRNQISVSSAASGLGQLTYNQSQGELLFTGPTAPQIRALFNVTTVSGGGSLTYNNSTGVFTYSGPTAAEIRSHFSAGTGVTISAGNISIGQAVGVTDSVTFSSVSASAIAASTLAGQITTAAQTGITSVGVLTSLETLGDIRVGGDLIVSGTTTTVDTQTVTLDDPIMTLAANTVASVPETKDRGVEFKWVDNGALKLGFMGFDTSTKKFIITADATNVNEEITGSAATVLANIEGTVSSLANHTTTSLIEGSNQYFTVARSRATITAANEGDFGSISYNSSTGVITYRAPSTAQLLNIFSAGTGIALSPPAVAGGPVVIGVNPGVVMTWDEFNDIGESLNSDELTEGTTNLFFTVDRARAAFSAGSDVSITSGAINVSSSISAAPGTIVKRTAVGGITGVHTSGPAASFILTNDRTLSLTEISSNIIRFEMTAARTLTLPNIVDANGYWLILRNTSGTFTLTVNYSGNTVATIAAGTAVRVACDGTSWFEF